MNKRSWVWRICALLAVLAFALGVAACGDDDDDDEGDSGTGTAAATAPANLTLGYVTTPQHPYGLAVDQYVKLVSDLSGGAMKITARAAYPGGDVPLLQDTIAGAPEMATVSTTVFDSAGPTNAFQALQAGPLFINNYAVERAALVDEDGGQSDLANDMLDQMESDVDSLVGLAIHEGGLRSPLGKEPLVTPADWQGKTIRATESGGMAEGLAALGAEPSAIPLPDVYDALRRGTVDGMEANTGLVATQDFYEQAKNFTGNVVLWPFPTALVMNKAAYDGLDEDQQQVLTDAADQLPAYTFDTIFGGGGGDPFAQNLANCGVKFLQASEADVAALATAGEAATESLAASDENVSDFIDRIKEVKDEVEDTATPATTAEPEPGVACEDISPD